MLIIVYQSMDLIGLIFPFYGKAHTTTTSGFQMAMHKLLLFLRNSCGCHLALCGAKAIYQLFISTILIFKGTLVSYCRRNINDTVSLLQALGFNINERKSVLTPTQSLEFLGFIINSTNMTITLTPRRKSNMAEVCTKLLLQTR